MKTKIGICGVDSGMLMIGDPCYFIGENPTIKERCPSWEQACNEIFCKERLETDTPMNVYDLGVAISTTYGDGVYPVYLETDEKGRRLIVELD